MCGIIATCTDNRISYSSYTHSRSLLLIADSGEYSCLSTQSIETVVTLSHSSDEPRDSHVPHPAAHPTRLLVYLSDADLDARVMLGADDSAAGRALPWYVGIHHLSALVLHLSLSFSLSFSVSSSLASHTLTHERGSGQAALCFARRLFSGAISGC